MSSKSPQAGLASASRFLSYPGNWVAFINRTLRGLLTTAQHTLMLFGLGSLALVGLLYLKPESINRLQAGIMRISQANAPAAPLAKAISQASSMANNGENGDNTDNSNGNIAATSPQTVATAGTASSPLAATGALHGGLTGSLAASGPAKTTFHSEVQRQQRWVANWLSRRYRVAGAATEQLVHTAYQTAHELQIDPLLILAVVAIESGFNPIAESPMGAQGLMQVMSKVHHDKFQSVGGIKEAFNPVANIKVGAQILKDYVTRGGSMEAGLKTYVGAAAFDNDTGYGSRVMAEYQRLKQVARGKTVPLNTAAAPARDANTNASAEQAQDKEQVAAL